MRWFCKYKCSECKGDKYHASLHGKEKNPTENICACHAKIHGYFKTTGSVSIFQQTWDTSVHCLHILYQVTCQMSGRGEQGIEKSVKVMDEMQT